MPEAYSPLCCSELRSQTKQKISVDSLGDKGNLICGGGRLEATEAFDSVDEPAIKRGPPNNASSEAMGCTTNTLAAPVTDRAQEGLCIGALPKTRPPQGII